MSDEIGIANSLRSLSATPYLIEDDADSRARLGKVLERSFSAREQAIKTRDRIARQAQAILGPFTLAVQSDLVAESNRLEGYDWTAWSVRETVALHAELLELPVHNMLESLRNDARVMEALGLFRAHSLANEWALAEERPCEHEVRALHQLILGGHPTAGRYKRADNRIGGSAHRPVSWGDTPTHMASLSSWWLNGAGDPVLEATIVHAWLTHIHPFDDGNGRLARLLANLTLIQRDYPPLLIRSDADRGQYLDALAASDNGDILPLYEIFTQVLRRTVRAMSRPGYIESIIEDRLLSTQRQRHEIWQQVVEDFQRRLTRDADKRGLQIHAQGVTDLESFELLQEYNPDGNGWFVKLNDLEDRPLWLLWFGFNSDPMRQLLGTEGSGAYPSLFISERSTLASSVHPYTPRWYSGDSDIPTEILLRPGRPSPAFVRWDYHNEELTLDQIVEILLSSLQAR